MTPRNLFTITLKTLGVFFINDIIATIPQLISTILYLKNEMKGEALWTFILTILILAVYIVITYLLIFRTAMIIDKLRLDQGFNQEVFTFNIALSSILTIAVIVTGAFILTTEIPNLCRYLFSYFQERRMTFGTTKPEISYSIYAGVKIILALLLIGERKRIVKFVESSQASPKEEEDTVQL
jgi:uncharacterized membrane protein YhdT